MRFGAMNFPVKPILWELDAIADLGMDYVELAMDPPQAHYSQIEQKKRAVKAALKAHSMGLVCHLPTFVHTADLTATIRQASLHEVLHSLETAADLGAEKVVLHPSYIGGLAVLVMEQALTLAMDMFDCVARRAEILGMTVCVENMFPKYQPFVEPGDFEAVFRAFPQFKLVLDTGHAHMDDPSGRRITDFITRYAHRLEHLHISDNHGRVDEHLAVGRGTIDFVAVARAFGPGGYDGTVTLEVFSENRNDLIDSRHRIQKCFAMSGQA
jgi:sugar phosphate isomerase/epimerase